MRVALQNPGICRKAKECRQCRQAEPAGVQNLQELQWHSMAEVVSGGSVWQSSDVAGVVEKWQSYGSRQQNVQSQAACAGCRKRERQCSVKGRMQTRGNHENPESGSSAVQAGSVQREIQAGS